MTNLYVIETRTIARGGIEITAREDLEQQAYVIDARLSQVTRCSRSDRAFVMALANNGTNRRISS